MQQPIIKAKKLDPRALLPHRAHATDSGADLFALERTVLPAHTVVKVRTGIAVELPENTSGIIWGKSSVESNGRTRGCTVPRRIACVYVQFKRQRICV